MHQKGDTGHTHRFSFWIMPERIIREKGRRGAGRDVCASVDENGHGDGQERLTLYPLSSSDKIVTIFVESGQAAGEMLLPRKEGAVTKPSGAKDTACLNTPVSGRSARAGALFSLA